MEILLTDKSMRVTAGGSVKLFLGEDISGVEEGSGSNGTAAWSTINLRDKAGSIVYTFDLRTPITGQPTWSNDYDGVRRAIADIAEILGVANCCAGGGGGIVNSVVAGSGISVDSTDPANPIVSATGGGGTGDVVGPASSTTDNIALFADTTGKLIKDAGLDLSQIVTTDGNPAGVSPIGSGAGVSPIELRRFVDGTGTEAQANTGSVQFNQKFSAADKFWYGGASAAPTEGDITAAGRALLDDASAADQRTTLLAAPIYRTINAQVGTSYTLAATDAVAFVTMSNGSPSTLDIATNASVPITVGCSIPIKQMGAGQVTITPAGGVTVRSFGNAYKLAGQYAECVLTKIGTDEWAVEGNLVA